jgi:hypothetical protein
MPTKELKVNTEDEAITLVRYAIAQKNTGLTKFGDATRAKLESYSKEELVDITLKLLAHITTLSPKSKESLKERAKKYMP